VPGAVETVEALHGVGKDVHIVSGGLQQSILPLAAWLGIRFENIHAVDVVFDEEGSYADFDRASPLARPGGKAEVCRVLGSAGKSVALVGDGATDIEAREAGAYVIGFGGVVVRDTVKSGADIFFPGPSLTAVLDALL
jgi:phosphoserine phosphatase